MGEQECTISSETYAEREAQWLGTVESIKWGRSYRGSLMPSFSKAGCTIIVFYDKLRTKKDGIELPAGT